MRHRVIALLGLLPVVLPPGAWAQEAPVELRVNPVLCITDSPDGACAADFRVQWSTARIGPYCLDNDFESAPLYCWERASSGRYAEQRVIIRSFNYRLMTPGHDEPVAEARVELMSVHEPDRRRSRRNRHAWSVL